MGPIAVLTSGGDAPGMNAAIRSLVKVAASRGVRVLGVMEGYDGLIDGRFRELTVPAGGTPHGLAAHTEVDLMGNEGGTMLGSARSARFRTPEGRAAAAANLAAVDGLLVIGGNGSLTGAHLLARACETPIVGIPASIDNDVGCTATALGVDTALNTIVESCDRITDTARSHRRVFVIEVMGRQSGYLAMASAIAAGADGVLLRETGRTEAQIVASVTDLIRGSLSAERARRRVLIIKAEGVEIPCTRLVRMVQEALEPEIPNVEVRATVLGHLVRGGRPSYQDRMVAGRLALGAFSALAARHSDTMLAWMPPVPGGAPTDDPAVFEFPLEHVLRETEALLDGSSPVTQWRVKTLAQLEGVLGL